jgi:DNA-binding NarL/FixJ family response regulator
MIRVMIADDHAIVREGLKQILSDVPDIEVAIEAASGDEALELAKTANWDVLLLDIAMPGKNILELIKLVKLVKPRQAILILSMYPEQQYAIRILQAGADGYLGKESAPEKLIAVIRKLAAGGKYISETIAEQIVQQMSAKENHARHISLTDREFQVFMAIAKGKRLSDIALEMELSIKTVSTYRTRLLDKLGLATNGDIIHYAIKYRLIETELNALN